MPDNHLISSDFCPDCEPQIDEPAEVSRREFLRGVATTVGGIAAASAFTSVLPARAQTAAAAKVSKPEFLQVKLINYDFEYSGTTEEKIRTRFTEEIAPQPQS